MAKMTESGSDFSVFRAYQLEMFEASLNGNTIVVMDTGSGKTHVYDSPSSRLVELPTDLDRAILRIMYELEHSPHHKVSRQANPQREPKLTLLPIIWFLVPTVALCTQQYEVLQENLPAVSIRKIVGSDNVERWKDYQTWTDILSSHQIIVSTYAILSNALDHGFITMDRLSLLVFDEAHHCSLNHPANSIMRNHYHHHVRQSSKEAVPAILGLTASPVKKARADPANLQLIEKNLNAIAVSPREHLDELRKFVHLPTLQQVEYEVSLELSSHLLLQLGGLLDTLDIWQDPYIKKLRSESFFEAKLTEVVLSRDTYNQKELRRFLKRAEHIDLQMGAWAGDLFISLAIKKLNESLRSQRQVLFGWRDEDKEYFCEVLSALPTDAQFGARGTPVAISEKVMKLIAFLTSPKQWHIHGIIFVDQRSTAAILCRILSAHPGTKHLKCATFVGTSDFASRRANIGDLVDVTTQQQSLEDFRNDKCDLMIGTSALEEGIDIPSCNLVVCFDKPSSLKSFIQRRGRARQSKSVFVIMVAKEDTVSGKINFSVLEEEMVRVFQDKRRELDLALLQEDVFEHSSHRLETAIPGAVLTLRGALEHLNHFCNTLPTTEHVSRKPIFKLYEDSVTGLFQAEVVLPNSIDVSIRRCLGSQLWRSQRYAKMAAAFEAYVALYRAGLVNEHLLPSPKLLPRSKLTFQSIQPHVSVPRQLNPWLTHACSTSPVEVVQPCEIRIKRPFQSEITMLLLVPMTFPCVPELKIFWNSVTVYDVQFECIKSPDSVFDVRDCEAAQRANYVLFQMVYAQRMRRGETDILTIFTPFRRLQEMDQWTSSNSGSIMARNIRNMYAAPPYQIVHSSSLRNEPRIFIRWIDEMDALETKSLPRRRNHLIQGQALSQTQTSTTLRIVPIDDSKFNRASTDAIEFALLIPSITRHLERVLVASHLCSNLLRFVGFSNISLVMEATTASSANEASNYQRLEFIGDSTLKFTVAIQLFALQPKWHEGYLSQAKDSIVANSRLARAAIDKGLARYIVADPFSPRKWRPMYQSQLLQQQSEPVRKMSAKVLADVVEALVGAALVDGGPNSAILCANVFLDEIKAQDISETLQHYHELLDHDSIPVTGQHLDCLQTLISYTFRDSVHLLSAITHPSLTIDTSTPSYQRLEFLGDAVLDMLIVQHLTTYTTPALSHVQMTLIKAALVNSEFLAFLCLENSTEEDFFEIQERKETIMDGWSEVIAHTVRASRRISLWEFMRFHSDELARARRECVNRYQLLAPSINEAICRGKRYPWSLLSRLGAPKFLSDVVEALLGAVFVDCGGDLDVCAKLTERLGIIGYLRRIVNDGVDVMHPKSRLRELVGKVQSSEGAEEGKWQEQGADKKRGKVRYTINKEEEEGRAGYRCFVSVGDTEFAEVRDGLSREEVTTRAADEAILALIGSDF